MKRSKEIPLLLSFLLFFSLGVSLMHAKKEEKNTGGFATLSPKDAVWQLSSLIQSRSVEKIAESLHDISAQKAKAIIDGIIQYKKSVLSRNDKLELLFAIAQNYPDKPEDQALFFSIFVEDKDLLKGKPILFITAESGYAKLIPAILSWANGYNKELGEQFLKNATRYAIRNNHFDEFTLLNTYGMDLTPGKATALMMYAINSNATSKFIPLLVNTGANVNFIYADKYTPLILAVMHGNYDTVKALVKAGADVNLIPDPVVGSPLQIAVRQELTKIDFFLREHGALE